MTYRFDPWDSKRDLLWKLVEGLHSDWVDGSKLFTSEPPNGIRFDSAGLLFDKLLLALDLFDPGVSIPISPIGSSSENIARQWVSGFYGAWASGELTFSVPPQPPHYHDSIVNTLRKLFFALAALGSGSGDTILYDWMEDYTDSEAVNGLDGGEWVGGAYVDRVGSLLWDFMEEYVDSELVNGLNLGNWVGGAYVDRNADIGSWAFDSMESYTAAVDVYGLNGGTTNGGSVVWFGAYVDKNGDVGSAVWDTLESYTDGADLAGLNGSDDNYGAAHWNGVYVDKVGDVYSNARDTMESYTDGVAVNGLNSGTQVGVSVSWNGAFVDR
jgi:hypothetical protein